jgi:DNA (cytosine-5)-methyltransferase 1
VKYISFFSGVAPQTRAWKELGLECVAFSEIEPFPCAVLKHHFPEIPNRGDIAKVDWSEYCGKVDLVVGGPPCQAFSVAGLRKSLDDHRGNLSLEYARAIDAIDPRYVLTENVPGWLSTGDNAFGCFLGAIVGADSALVPARGQRWTDAGVVAGPKRTAAWRILDAQFFKLAQRRRRVFVLAVRGSGNWSVADALFPVSESLSGNPSPSREKGKRVTRGVEIGPSGGSFTDLSPTLDSRAKDGFIRNQLGVGAVEFAIGLNEEQNAVVDGFGCLKSRERGGGFEGVVGVPDLARCLSTKNERIDWETETFVPVAFSAKDHGADASQDVSPTLRAGGFDKSHANSGNWMAVAVQLNGDRDNPGVSISDEVAFTLPANPMSDRAQAVAIRTANTNANGHGIAEECAHTLDGAQGQAIAFHSRQDPIDLTECSLPIEAKGGQAVAFGFSAGQSAEAGSLGYQEEQSPTLRGAASGTNQVPAIAFAENQRHELRTSEIAPQLSCAGGKPGSGYPATLQGMAVRRLTPRECERLQGFEDDYTLVPWRGKMAPDGPRYKAIGNSWAVPVLNWLAKRIMEVSGCA